MKLLPKRSYDYHKMDRRRNNVKHCLGDVREHSVKKGKLFKKLTQANKAMYESELAESEIEHKNPKFVGFFVLQYAKLRMLELY